MNNVLLRYYRQRYFYEAIDWLEDWLWEWIGHITLDKNYNDEVINKKLLQWVRKIQTREHMQIAYMGILCRKKGHPHVHLLMLGRGNANNRVKTLLSVDSSFWGEQWPHFAKVERINDWESAIRYIAAHVFRSKCDEHELIDYNQKLLHRCSMRRGFVA